MFLLVTNRWLHLRGSITLGRLSILYPSRFIAFAWLGLSFREPTSTTFDLEKVMALFKQTFGSETLAYWQFFNREDAPAIIEKNVRTFQLYPQTRVTMSYQIDSFIQLFYPKDPGCWNPYMVAPGKTAQWLENNMTPGFADYLNEEVRP
jgi:soluble epoxide hydrolase/lipid-phosphate phosphatase